MRVSLNWIKEYTNIVLPPEELRERVSVSLTEVEAIDQFNERFKSIVVGLVKSVEKHPVSDSLLVLKLDVGPKEVQVVVQYCPVKEGDKVPFLYPGTTVPGEIGANGGSSQVSAADIKGVSSAGMVPSGRELGLNHDHTTVYILPTDAKVGCSLSEILDLTDVVMEIKNKPLTHRPDVFSVEGIAREIAAIQRTPYKPLKWLQSWESLKPEAVEDRLPVVVDNQAKALCSRYMAVVLDNVAVGPSPKWMQIRLAKVGIRPVNNVVDISNYLMIETGQPSHAFDYDKIVLKDPSFKGTATIIVRLAQGGESITTIDGEVHQLQPDTIIISDSAHPIGIAGVMGGKDTEIGDDTKRVIFQVENLDMYNVRRTSMKLGIFSEAVTRFSRGLDPNRCEPVLYKGIHMLQELAGATVASAIKDNYDAPLKPKSISVSPDWIRRRVGFDIADAEMEAILRGLGLLVTFDKKQALMSVEIPTYRRDLAIQEDIEEEIVRIFGFDRITPTLPTRSSVPIMMSPSRRNRIRVKEILAAAGAHEVYTYSFVGSGLYQSCGLELEGSYRLRNPLSPELSYMRPLLLPSLLEKFVLNKEAYASFALFEIDIVNPPKGQQSSTNALPEEPWHVALVHSDSFYHAKSYIEEVLSGLHVDEAEIIPLAQTEASELPSWVRYAQSSYNASRTGYIRVKGEMVGLVGQLSAEVCGMLDIEESVSGVEVDMSTLQNYVLDVSGYRDTSKT
jgi:phenylalanyl-tRNA synthetase beta chain